MSKEKRTTLPLRSPRPWHGMTPQIWFGLLAASRFAISPSRIPMALSISIFVWLNLVLAWISEAIYGRRARETKLRHAPLFVLGHWRTGTTLLHELLAEDKRFIYPTMFDCMAPRHFLLSARFFGRWLGWLLPKARPMDGMAIGFDRPQEDEFALMNLGADSPYLEWAFPNRGAHTDSLALDTLAAERREHWKSCLDWFVRRQTLKNTAARLILKSPGHTARIRSLLEFYPDAKFIHIVRDPRIVIPSTARTWKKMCDAVGLQVRRDRPLEDQVLQIFELMHDRFEQDRAMIPADNFHELRYEDLIADPLSELDRIYGRLDLGDFATARPAMAKHLENLKNYKTNHYDLDEELAARIQMHCGDYMQRYGYADPPN